MKNNRKVKQFDQKLLLTKVFFLSSVLFLLSNASSLAKNIFDKVQYGVFFNAAYISNTANVSNMQSSLFPQGSASGSDIGGYYGIFGMLPVFELNDKPVIAGFRLSFLDYGAKMKFDASSNDESTPLDVKASFAAISLSPIMQYNFWNNFRGQLGLQVDFPILAEYELTKSGEKVSSNDFENPSINAKLQLGLSYLIPLGVAKGLYIAPEVNFFIGLNNMLGGGFNSSWKSNIATFGFSFIRDAQANAIDFDRIYADVVEIDTVRRLDVGSERMSAGKNFLIDSVESKIDEKTIKVTHYYKRVDTLIIPKKDAFEIETALIAMDKNGNEIVVDDNFRFETEEVLTVKQLPLLNYIFFDEGSSTIPKRYKTIKKSETSTFTENRFFNLETLDAYYHLLNIVGKRMSENSHYRLTIEGCNDNYSDNELDNLELSRARAVAIQNYLSNVWKINKDRLVISARNLPENPSLKENEPEKMQENRRVELLSNDLSLFDPVSLESISIESNVKTFKLKGDIISSKELLNYTLTNSFNEKIINTVSVNNPQWADGTTAINESLSSDIVSDKTENEYKILFVASDKMNNLKSFRKSIPAYFYTVEEQQKKNEKKQISKYSLILFDFRKATIGGRNDKIIQDIISKTDPNSDITIEGYTDRTGKDEFNTKLSLQRAESVKAALNFPQAKTSAANNNTYLYDNDFPEGRFYCRTVEITVVPPSN